MAEKTKEEVKRNFRKVRDGFVVSDKMDKTVVVAVENRYKHKIYKKVLKKTVKTKADTGKFKDIKVGDLVRIMETRPISKTKHFRVMEVLQKAK